MKKSLLMLLIAAVLGLNACATHLSQEQCASMSWQSEGLNDGYAGHPLRDLTQSAQDCQKFQIGIDRNGYVAGWHQGMVHYCTPDFNTGAIDGSMGRDQYDITNRNTACAQAGLPLKLKAYEQGRLKGLRTYCTRDNGMTIARQGHAMPEVCHDYPAFASGWHSGAELLCNQPMNAFALGKNNQSYPDACSPDQYMAFKSEYDRGAGVSARIQYIENHIHEIKEEIRDLEHKNHLERHGDYYALGQDKSPDAQHALDHVMDLARESRKLEHELFDLRLQR